MALGLGNFFFAHNIIMAFGLPPAQMGFVGYCQFLFNGSSDINPSRYQARATSCDLKLSQPIHKPEITDIRYDRNSYVIRPEEIGGKIEFPVVLYDSSLSNKDAIERLYELATLRDFRGRLTNLDISVKYAAINAAYIYKKCYINSFTFSVEQGSTINISTDIVGKHREEGDFAAQDINNSRVATWNDVFVNYKGEFDLRSSYFRRFQATVNNNIERLYTANGKLYAQDLAPRQRDIDGSFTIMGRYPNLARYSRDNPTRCIEDGYLEFGYIANCDICADDECTPTSNIFKARMPNVVLEIEEISLTNDILETSISWHSVPTDHDLSALSGNSLSSLLI